MQRLAADIKRREQANLAKAPGKLTISTVTCLPTPQSGADCRGSYSDGAQVEFVVGVSADGASYVATKR